MIYKKTKHLVSNIIKNIFVKPLMHMDFINSRYYSVHGDKKRLILEADVRPVNTLFNTSSGNIYVEPGVVFGHNCMVLTGRHTMGSRIIGEVREFQKEGNDIRIGEGSYVGSGSIIIGGVRIGKYCVIGAGAVVTKDVPDFCFAVGVPAVIKKKSNNVMGMKKPL